MTQVSKSGISLHREGFAGDFRAAVNVKVRNFPIGGDAERLASETGLTVERCEVLLERAFEWQKDHFWDIADFEANELLGAAFPGRELTCYSEGRSGGWLVVEYKPVGSLHGSVNQLPDVDEWTAEQVDAWRAFEEWTRAEIADLCAYDSVKGGLLDDGMLDPEAERDEVKRRAEAIANPYGFDVVDREAS